MENIPVSEIINELGEDRERYFNAVAPPIFQTSNFAFESVSDFRKALKDEASAFLYSRGNNPSLAILQKKLAALSHAEACLVLNSGAGAIFVSVLANVKSGDHIISVENPYSWAKKMFDNVLPRFGITTTYVDGRDMTEFKKSIRPNTTLIYLESPNSWTFYLQDLKAVADLAKQHHIVTICDNSYCTPLYQKPIDLGIDITLQSATKYINGHSDVVAGVLCGTKAMMGKIFISEYMNLGIGTTPFNAWLMVRGLRTLQVRMERVSQNAAKVVEFLKTRNEVESVSFPMDKDFPQKELVQKQMTGGGGLLSFVLKTKDFNQIESFCNGLNHILMAVSWGGHESLIIPAISSISPDEFHPENPEHRRLRLYIGLEDPDYLTEDLKTGLSKMSY
ncbi:MAG: PLP-dependent transferase [Chitinophagaceae bacterium]|nr:PLP-dependent transferase [Chitinophagaceae bacterium]